MNKYQIARALRRHPEMTDRDLLVHWLNASPWPGLGCTWSVERLNRLSGAARRLWRDARRNPELSTVVTTWARLARVFTQTHWALTMVRQEIPQDRVIEPEDLR